MAYDTRALRVVRQGEPRVRLAELQCRRARSAPERIPPAGTGRALTGGAGRCFNRPRVTLETDSPLRLRPIDGEGGPDPCRGDPCPQRPGAAV